jgi:hypothetical protein
LPIPMHVTTLLADADGSHAPTVGGRFRPGTLQNGVHLEPRYYTY